MRVFHVVNIQTMTCRATAVRIRKRLSVVKRTMTLLANFFMKMTRVFVALYTVAIAARSGKIQSMAFGSVGIFSGAVKLAMMSPNSFIIFLFLPDYFTSSAMCHVNGSDNAQQV